MRRQTLNKNVLKAMTIGIAAVMSVSQPMMVFAAENGTEGSSNENATAEGQVSSNTENSSETSAEEAVTAESVVEAIDDAAEAVKEHQTETNSQVAGDEAILEKLGDAKDILSESEDLKDQNLKDALASQYADAAAVLDENVNALVNSLADVPDKEKNNQNPSTGYLENSSKDDKNKDRLQYEVPREENGDLKLDEDALPSLGESEAKLQLSGQYDNTYSDSALSCRSVQGTYQAGMDQIQNAITALSNGNTEEADGYIAKASDFLNACETKFADSDKALTEAWNQYTAAEAAAKEADKCLEGVSEEVLSGAIKDTTAAQAKLDAAKKKTDQLKAISDQWYATMVSYFEKDSKTKVLAEDGSLDVAASAEAARKKNNTQVNQGGSLNGATYNYGRGLLEQLVIYGLEEQGATNIQFGVKQDRVADHVDEKDSSGKDTWKLENKAVTVATVNADGTITDKADGKRVMASYSNSSEKGFKTEVNGRENHVKVTYTDASGVEQTKYFNYAIKGKNYEGANVDFENGVLFVTEVKYDETTGKWKYTPYSADGSGFLDNFNLTRNYAEAQAAVDEAAAKVDKLAKELEAMQKVATNKTKLAELKGMLDNAQTAFDNSKKGLNDLRDLYNYLTEGVQPSDFIEIEEEIGDQPDVLPPSEDDGVVTDGDVIPGDGDVVTDDGADADDDGDTVVDVAGVTITIPGGNIIPAGLFNNAIAGGRVNTTIINDNEVPLSNGTATNSQTSVASPTAISPVDKILGNKQDNSQLVKKIKDNEIPLAEIPNMDDEVKMNWMWLLIIFLLGATGKKMYDEYKKKKEAEEAAKINK